MENKIYVNTRDINDLKAKYSMPQEDLMILLNNNYELFNTNCPNYCDIEKVLEIILN